MVTSSWPREDDPSYGVFIKRQLDSLTAAGLQFDVLFIHGYRSPLAYPLAAAQLARLSLFPRRRYRIVHAHGGEAGVAAWFYRRAPLFVSYCGDDLLGTPQADGSFSRAARLKRAVLRQHARLARRTITKSEPMQRVLPRGVQRWNAVIPNGVDVSEFRPRPREAERGALGWDPAQRVVLFAADPAIPRKRHSLAEAACAVVRRRLPDVHLEVAAHVPAAQMPLLMSAADCLLLTSTLEGSPNVVKEAVMCNLPVVTTRVGDVDTILRDVRPSCVCEATSEALAGGLVECLTEPRRSNGREVCGWLDARLIAERILGVYTEIFDPKFSPGSTAEQASASAEVGRR